MKKMYITLLACLFATIISAQSRVVVQVSAPEDDMEEYIAGPTQVQEVGSIDSGSSDLELGSESADGTEPQMVGVRFRNVSIPQGAIITNARLIFTVDNTSKNTDPSVITIKVQDADNPDAFNESQTFNISSRATLSDSITWNIGAGTWGNIGDAGDDQTTPNLAALVQQIVNRGGWMSGNAMVFTFQGTGTREAESYEGDPAGAAQLVVDFVVPEMVMSQISSGSDDVEESLDNAGAMDVTSSDIELGSEDADGGNNQLAGLRFTNITLPEGAVVSNAYIQFTVDETKGADAASAYTISVEANANPETYSGDAGSVSSRTTLEPTVSWEVAANTWTNPGDAGADQQTPNLAALVNAAISQDGWASGNAIAFQIGGTGTKAAESFDGDAAAAPKLMIQYTRQEEVSNSIAGSNNDAEESLDNGGAMDIGSSDLELGAENADGTNNQITGLRFENIELEPGATIESAFIQFTVDENKGADAASSLTISGQADANPGAFEDVAGNISSRAKLSTTVAWDIAADTWSAVGEAGPAQRTPDISAIINEIINQSGWASGNALVLMLEGTGTKTAESFDGDAAGAPQLIINVALDGKPSDVSIVLEDCDDSTPEFDEEELELFKLDTYESGIFDEAAAEIVAFDPTSNRLFSTNADSNSVTILDITTPSSVTFIGEIDMDQYGGGVNSVAVYNGLVAVAVEADPSTDPGSVVFFDNLGNFLNQVTVGALPDMITFNEDGTLVLTANEGQPSDDYTVDPEGSVSIIDISNGPPNASVTNITFESYNDKAVSLRNKGVRIFGPGATVAQDLEPEYIAVVDSLAYVALQENNALAVINLNTSTLLDLLPLGTKDHNSGSVNVNEFVLNELIEDFPALGTPQYDGGQPTVFLGGFSGLYYDEAESTETSYVFYAIPDRGPNDGAVNRNTVTPAAPANLRPFKLPNYQGRIAKFTVNLEDGGVSLDDQIFLTRQDGTTPISGRGNVPGFDEVPVIYAGSTPFLNEDFQNQAAGLNGFIAFSVASNADWAYDNFGEDFFVEMNGFGADEASEDWLITPVLDLTSGTDATFSFSSTRGFDGGSLNVLISTDYDGVSNPNGFNWTDITSSATLSPGSNAKTSSGDIDITAFISATTYVAFQYISTGTGGGDGARWQIDDILVSSTDGGPFASVDFTGDDGETYHQLEYDPFGGDFEGILKDNDGNFWMCDEYRPALYKFQPNGTLIERYVPSGTSQLGTASQMEGFYGSETLPAVYSNRRANRGFEAIAYDGETNTIYAFIQSPMDNPSRNNTDVIRILGVNAADGTPVSEYVYLLERNFDSGVGLSRVDKIGDAVYVGNGVFMVLERDSSWPDPEGKKFVFKADLKGATNILGTALSIEDGNSGTTLEQYSADELANLGVQALTKTKVLNLPSVGYNPSDKPEGLVALPGGRIAVLNDNDFGIAGAGVSDNSTLGIIEFCTDNGLDASNRNDDIVITNWPTLGYYMPDAIAAFKANGKRYIVSANEGDARDYSDDGGYNEEARVADLTLDPTVYPNAADLQDNANLGRLKTTIANGDFDGDGDYDQIYSYGARSFSIWDEFGNLVYDSGSDFEKILAEVDPDNFNSTNDENDSRKNRSDDKGPEPEAIEIVVKGDTTFALIGLERQGGIMIYNITDPAAPYFVNYLNNRNFDVAAQLEDDSTNPEVGDLGIEDVVFISAEDSPTGEALVVTANEVSGTITIFGAEFEDEGFEFRLMHNNDGESKLEPSEVGGRMIGGAAPFKTVVDSLRAEALPSMMLSSGDNYLPSVAFNASLNRDPSLPFYDAEVLDALQYDAIAIGNHDFDNGPDVLEDMIRDFTNTMPPYLSANLDFSGEPGLQALVDEGRIAGRTIVDIDGERVGVVGLIWENVNTITSLRNVTVDTAVMAIAQQNIDELMAEGVNKIILITHLQSINREIELISNLSDVDVVIAGGGDEFLTNDVEKNALPGFSQFGPYPLRVQDADGKDVLLVTTPGEYRYVGNLGLRFNDAGEVDAVLDGSDLILVADITPDSIIDATVVDSIRAYSAGLDMNIIARTEVDLDGTRGGVRTRETNQGNLIADAFLYLANRAASTLNLDPNTAIVAVQNGGGIRNDEIIPAGSDISEGKTFDMLPFPNNLGIIDPLTPTEFKAALENAVDLIEDVDGGFLQVAGFSFVYDSLGVPGESRIVSVRLNDENNTSIVEAYEVVEGAPNVYIATNNFTAGGGDDFVEFAGKGFTLLGFSYQRALFEYLIASTDDGGLGGVVTAEQYPAGGEGRIRRLETTSVETFNLNELGFTANPNPFVNEMNITYRMNETSQINIDLFDVAGRYVQNVVSEKQNSGLYTYTVNTSDLPAGEYNLVVRIGGKVGTLRVIKQ